MMFAKNWISISQKMTILWPSGVLLRENPLILWGLSWAHVIAHILLKNNFLSDFFSDHLKDIYQELYIYIYYCPSVKWLGAGPFLVMRAIMPPPPALCLISWPKPCVS